jgi:hypothetical protein
MLRKLFSLPILMLLTGCLLPELDTPPLIDANMPATSSDAQTNPDAGDTTQGSDTKSDTQVQTGCSGTTSGSYYIRPGVLAGLKNPCVIDGSLTIGLEATAAELASVNGLQTVTGNLKFESGTANPGLVLPDLRNIYGSLTFTNLQATFLSGFDLVERVDQGVHIMDSPGVKEIRGFGGLGTTPIVEISNLGNLELVDAFAGLTSVNHIRLTYLSKLTTLLGLGTHVTGKADSIWLNQLQLLKGFPPMGKVTEIGALEASTTGLLGMGAWPALAKVQTLTITNNLALVAMEFPVLTQITTGLYVGSNPYLKSLAGLEAVTSCGQVRFCNNHADLTEELVHAWIAVHGGEYMKCN